MLPAISHMPYALFFGREPNDAARQFILFVWFILSILLSETK